MIYQNVLIFGTGYMAGEIVDDVSKKYNIVGFLDNSIEKQHRYWRSGQLKIYAPDEVSELQFDKVILASTNYASEMFLQLLRLGVREHDIIVDYVCRTNKVYLYDFLYMQINKWGDFNRVDIAVKYLAVESYMADSEEGIKLYKKMQQKRLGLTHDQTEAEWNKFKLLIDSVRENGYDEHSYIVCDEMMRVMDGAHRVAVCLYFNILMLPVKMTPQKFDCDYRIEWFWNSEFLASEISDIEGTLERMSKSDKQEIIAFIWPPAMKYCAEIKSEIEQFAKIKSTETRYFNDAKLSDFVRAVYSVDDIESWKVEKKIEHMLNCNNEVEIMALSIDAPRYRLKSSTALPLSVQVEELKKIIRNRFKDRINDYYFDNILHISDNYYQSALINKIMQLHLDISECFSRISDLEYALSKLDVPYMVCDFPKSFPVHKDADILCKKTSYSELVKEMESFTSTYVLQNGLSMRKLNEQTRTKIRVEYLGFLIYQFDISYSIENLGEQFVNSAVSRRVREGGIYILDEMDEIEIRKNECILYPNKVYHKEYLLMHKKDINAK